MPNNDAFHQLTIDIAVLKSQMGEVKESMERIESFLTQNGLMERIAKHGTQIEELMKLKTWIFWILGTIGVGVIVNFVRLTSK